MWKSQPPTLKFSFPRMNYLGRGDVPSPKSSDTTSRGSMGSFTVKENHIGIAFSRSFGTDTQTQTVILLLLYKDIKLCNIVLLSKMTSINITYP